MHSKFNLEEHLIIKMPSVTKRENISHTFNYVCWKSQIKKFGPNKRYNEGREVLWLRTLSEL